ncbi:MAG: group 1 truncated hemoglobin [Gammaproteobacteria bacterium]
MADIRTLYERVGGYDAIYAFIEYVIARMMAREEVGKIWKHMSEERVKAELQSFCDFASSHWGGPAVYQGRDMIAAHKGMGITEAHWQELLEVLDEAYAHFQLAEDLRTDVTRFLTAFKSQVVGSPSFRDVVREAGGTRLSGGLADYGVQWPSRGR